MDARLTNPFLASVHNVFPAMVGTEVQLATPHIKNNVVRTGQVGAIIDLSGDAWDVWS